MAELIECTYEEYDKIDALRSSELKLFQQSPSIYADFKRGDYVIPESNSLRIGKVLHSLLIEGEKEYAVFEGVRRGKKWVDFQDANTAKPILRKTDKVDEEADILKMVESVQKCPPAMELFGRVTNREQTILFDYKGLPCKVRLDLWMDNDEPLDVKTSVDPTCSGFFRNGVNKFGYHQQAAFYTLGVNAYLGEQPRDFYWIAVSNKQPWRTIAHKMNSLVGDIGHYQVTQALDKFIVCQEQDEWPDNEANELQEYIPDKWWLERNDIEQAHREAGYEL